MLRAKALLTPILHLWLAVGCTAFSSSGQHTTTVTGTVETDLSGGKIYYEFLPGSETGGAVYLEGRILIVEQVIAGKVHSIHVTLPPGVAPGEYDIISPTTDQAIIDSGTPRAQYSIVSPGQLAMFSRDVRGWLAISEGGETLSGSLEFTAHEFITDGEVTVSGRFDQLAYSVRPHTPVKVPRQAASTTPSGGGLPAQLTPVIGIMILVALVLINFVFQFWVGSQVYEQGVVIQSLRGTRTFIRGWRQPELRGIMVGWSVDLVLLLIAFCWLGVLAAGAR